MKNLFVIFWLVSLPIVGFSQDLLSPDGNLKMKFALSKEVQRTISVIPVPMEYELQKGYFSIDSLTLFSDVSSLKVKYLIDKKLTQLGREGYTLEVTSR